MLVDYPAQLPVEAGTQVFDIVRRGAILTESDVFAHRAWNIQGYLQSRAFGNPGNLAAESFGVSNGELEELEQKLTTAVDELEKNQYTGGIEAGAIDPVTIIMAIDLIIQLIKILRG